MKEEQSKFTQASYIPYDEMAGITEHFEGTQGGETCRVDELKDVFAWMRGFMYGWYGWANDGKGTFFDFMAIMKAKYDGWKFCCYKPEDMDSVFVDGLAEIKANRIYKNLAWTLTGKTWNKNYAERFYAPRMTEDEEHEALKFIKQHFFIIYPEDRQYKNLIDNYQFMYEKYGINSFLLDPWNAVKMPNDNERGDERLVSVLMDIKTFALKSNTVFNIITHPKVSGDIKVGKGKDAKYKVVDQFMILGGSAWDMKMDAQFSIYRPERHIDPKDAKVEFHNLKQKQGEIVGVDRGVFGRDAGESIIFDRKQKRYFFNGICPIDGSMTVAKARFMANQQPDIFSKPKEDKPVNPDEPPF